MTFIRNRNHKLVPYFALGMGVICIGCSGIFVKIARVPGPVSAFYRILVAGIVIVPWWFYRKSVYPSRSDLILTLGGGIFFALDLVFWNTGVLLTSAATATLLANNAPLWVGLGSILLFQERLPPSYWLGLIISLGGMIFLVGVRGWSHLQMNTGDLLAIVASGFYAAYLLTIQEARTRIDTLTFMTLSVVSSLLVLFGLNLVLGTPLIGYTGKTWTALVGLGLVSQLGGWLAINYALGHLRAAPVSVSLLGEAVVTALLAIPVLGEYLNIHQVVGGVLVLGGIYFVNQRGRQKQ